MVEYFDSITKAPFDLKLSKTTKRSPISETLWCKGAIRPFLVQIATSHIYMAATNGLQLRLADLSIGPNVDQIPFVGT